MAYKQYDAAHPDPDNDAGADTLNYIKDNEAALRDAIIMGVFPFFNIEAHGDDLSLPDYWLYKRGQVWIRITPTRDEDDEITSSKYEISYDAGSSWEEIGDEAINRDAQGNFSNTSWS